MIRPNDDGGPEHSQDPAPAADVKPANPQVAPVRDAAQIASTPQVASGPSAPRPILKKSHWPFPLIWLVPLLAACLAGYYFYDRMEDRGPMIAVAFSDVNGLTPDQTPVTVHGVPIGTIVDLSLGKNNQALANIRLKRQFASVAKTRTRFWVVRPEVSEESISGLGTLVSGPYIEALPGDGDVTRQFTGLEHEPHNVGQGLEIFLFTSRLEHLQPGSAVIYRGVEVGSIQDADLNNDASAVRVRAIIAPRYAPLVRGNSRFWSTSGAEVNGGVFSGIHVRLNSLRGLISGSVTFATPDDVGAQARDGAVFDIYPEPRKEWLDWSPAIMLPHDDGGASYATRNPPKQPARVIH